MPYDTFDSLERWTSREAFTGDIVEPHLVVLGEPVVPLGLDTLSGQMDADVTRRSTVIPVCKVTVRFSFMITLGRSPLNDLIVDDGRVSKFHGYLREQGSKWVFVDANSKNGTRINGTPVTANEPVTLRCGDRLSFGGREALFFSPGGLYDYLSRAQLGAGAPANN